MNDTVSNIANVRWQAFALSPSARAAAMGQKPCCIWMTGLPGSGKSTLSNLLDQALNGLGKKTFLLDGDNVRHGLNRDLGFSAADRAENIRRVGEVAKLMTEAGLIVIVSFISPYRADRATARALFGADEFIEVFVDASLEACEQRDPKGLYAKARRGELHDLTGVGGPYEIPENAEIHLRSDRATAPDCVETMIEYLRKHSLVDG